MAGMKKKATPSPKPKTKSTANPGLASGYLNPNAAGNKKAVPLTWAQKQKKAEADLLKKRKAQSKKTGSWPNYKTN